MWHCWIICLKSYNNFYELKLIYFVDLNEHKTKTLYWALWRNKYRNINFIHLYLSIEELSSSKAASWTGPSKRLPQDPTLLKSELGPDCLSDCYVFLNYHFKTLSTFLSKCTSYFLLISCIQNLITIREFY